MDLKGIWTPAYYGDEEDFEEEGEEEEEKKKKDTNENWVLFSTRDGRLLLRKGPHGKIYPINGQYEVKIDDHVVTGGLLSELIDNVRRETCHSNVANQRRCPSTIYVEDLRHFAGSKEITPLANEQLVEVVGKGDFSEVMLANYTEQTPIPPPSTTIHFVQHHTLLHPHLQYYTSHPFMLTLSNPSTALIQHMCFYKPPDMQLQGGHLAVQLENAFSAAASGCRVCD
ncbi:unnamed protein product [Taenia asiatica]|uniref:SH2 domain-containing protein n=1 Tax=Taenia asiatica TaxID=60517 RepID=A0A0R3VZ19_TAEAS|nr:unnamed protein product [Taenia asiatica]